MAHPKSDGLFLLFFTLLLDKQLYHRYNTVKLYYSNKTVDPISRKEDLPLYDLFRSIYPK